MDDGVIQALAALARETEDLDNVLDALLLAAARLADAPGTSAAEGRRRSGSPDPGQGSHVDDETGGSGSAPQAAQAGESARPSPETPDPKPRSPGGPMPEGPLWLVHPGSASGVHGPQLSIGRAPALPDALGIGRALRPLRLPRPSAVRRELDVEATVALYAGSGLLVPQLRPAPEPWLEAIILLDRGSAMGVWAEAVRTLSRSLRELGAFRSVQMWHLDHPRSRPAEVRDQSGRLLEPALGPGVRPQPPQRMLLVVSDCAAPAWHTKELWQALGVWNRTARVALINPMPPRLWRRPGLDLPRTTAYAAAPAASGGTLTWRRHRLLPDTPETQPWQALPVVPLTPAGLLSWSRAVMRMDPAGCDAVLVPATGRPPARGTTSDRSRAAEPAAVPTDDEVIARAEAFIADATPEAVRLAVCASSLDTFTLPLLDILRERAVQAGSLPDIAEFLTAGLLNAAQAPDDPGCTDPLYTFHPAAGQHLRTLLTRDQLWQTHFALSDHLDVHARGQGGFPIAWEDPDCPAHVPASQLPILTGAVSSTARLLGLEPADESPSPATPVPTMAEPVPAEADRPVLTVRGNIRPRVLLSYVSEDRMWAEWITKVLSQAGLRVIPRNLDADTQRDSERDATAMRTLAIWSGSYTIRPRNAWNWGADDLILVHIDAVAHRPLGDSNSIELAGLDAAATRAVLLDSLDLTDAARQPLPDEGPRFPGLQPTVSNLPGRDPSFTGREALLTRLRDQLCGPLGDRDSQLPPSVPQVLSGIAGIGKTRIALEYANRFKADYDVVWWIRATDPHAVASAFWELSRVLGLNPGEGAADTALRVMDALRLRTNPRYPRWLLIFDDADSAASLAHLIQGGHGHILMIGRKRARPREAEALVVDRFERAESITYLCSHVPGLTRSDADQMAAAVGDLPAALAMARDWLNQYAAAVETSLEQLLQDPIEALPRGVRLAWLASFAALREESPAAFRLLQLCAFLAADGIPFPLFRSDQMVKSLRPYDDRVADALFLSDLLTTIDRHHLIRVDRDEHNVQLPRLLREVIRAEMSWAERDATAHEVRRILVGVRRSVGEVENPENWSRFELMIWPHLTSSGAEDCDEHATRRLLLDRIHYLWLRGELDRAEELGHRLDRPWTVRLGEDDPQILQLRFHLGRALHGQGRYGEAHAIDVDTLQRGRRILGDQHPQTLQSAGGLAADLRALGRFAEALRLDQDTYDQLHRIYGKEHPDTLHLANSLAIDLRLNGDYDGARLLDEETWAARSALLAPRHPWALASQANLAEDLRALGDYSGAVALLTDVLDDRSAPAPAPDLASLRYSKSLAVALRKSGQYREARLLTLGAHRRYLERNHSQLPDALSCAMNLAAEYSVSGDKEAATDMAQAIYDQYIRILGDEHPFTLICANNLSIYQRGGGRVDEAVVLGERTLAQLQETLGPDHPYALCAMVNLANSLSDSGVLHGAEELTRAALSRLTEHYGFNHPDTLVCAVNLAITLRQLGEQAGAHELRTRAIEGLIPLLGEQHSTVVSARAWQRKGLDLEIPPV